MCAFPAHNFSNLLTMQHQPPRSNSQSVVARAHPPARINLTHPPNGVHTLPKFTIPVLKIDLQLHSVAETSWEVSLNESLCSCPFHHYHLNRTAIRLLYCLLMWLEARTLLTL